MKLPTGALFLFYHTHDNMDAPLLHAVRVWNANHRIRHRGDV